MKKHLLMFAMVIAFSFIAEASKPRVINQPAYEVSSTGIYNITKIELSDESTRLHVLCDFIPRWWVQFNDDDKITDNLGNEYAIEGAEGTKLGEKLWMPDDGDSTVVLIFPPLMKNAEKIDFNDQIFGIALSKRTKSLSKEIPEEVEQWIEEELQKPSAPDELDLEADNLFTSGTAKIVGYIKGYDPRLDFNTGIIYTENLFTRESYPTVMKVYKDGRFEVKVDLQTPLYSSFVLNREWIPFYVEPGHTLAVVLDWDEFLVADRKRNINYQFRDVKYRGTLAQTNAELLAYTGPTPNYRKLREMQKKMYPEDFKSDQLEQWDKALLALNEYLEKADISGKAATILKDEITLNYGTFLFDFAMNRSYFAKEDTTNEVLNTPTEPLYYDFLKRVNLNSPSLVLHSDYSSFLNRYEFNQLYPRGFRRDDKTDVVKLLLSEWAKKDSVVYEVLELKPSLTHDITRIRALPYELEHTFKEKELASEYWQMHQESITEPFLMEEGSRLLNEIFPDEEPAAYELAEGPAKEVFEKIIEPHRGKVLFVDFWATSCGPCIGSIKRMKDKRAELRDREDMIFLFITDEGGSPEGKYDEFVAEQELENTHRLTKDEFNYLRELFRFNGIPKYVVIDPEGKVLDEDFEMYNFDFSFESIMAKAKKE